MKILVTGGAGFIGSYLCHQLVSAGHSVTAYDNLMLGRREFVSDLESLATFRFLERDLVTDENLTDAVRGHDLVYHLAANSDISRGAEATDLDLRYGILATYNLLEAMRLGGVKKLIFASTSAIYGEAMVRPTPETYGPLIPISFYGASKLSAEALIAAFAHNHGIQSWIFRFANIVGPNLTHGAIYDFSQRLAKSPKVLKVLGNGTQRKSYLHVSDCVDGMWFGFQKSQAEVNIFNLASQGVTEVRRIAEEVVRQLGHGAAIEYGKEDRGWKGDVPFTWLDGGKLRTLGWEARLSSDESVLRAVTEVNHPGLASRS